MIDPLTWLTVLRVAHFNEISSYTHFASSVENTSQNIL